MNARDVERLALALCDVEHIYSQEHREQLMRYLPRAVRRDVDASGAPSVFARRLVQFCQDRECVGCLLRWVLHLEDRGRSARTAAEAARPLLDEEEYALLAQHVEVRDARDVGTVRDELSRVLFDKVEAVFERVRPPTLRVETPEPATAWDALMDLAERPAPPDGEPPVLLFCAEVARHLRTLNTGLLEEWGRGLRPPEPPGTPPAPERPARLVVRVGQGTRRGRYEVEYWTVLSQRRGEEPEFCDHDLHPDVDPASIGERIGGLLSRMEADPRAAHHGGRRVELVAPLLLLDRLQAESWQRAHSGGVPLGARAEVVYRAEELLPDRADRDAWSTCVSRWQRLESSGEALALDEFHDRGMDDDPLPERLRDDRVIVLSVPSRLSRWYTQVWSAITLGVPVVVWRSAEFGPGIGSWLNPVRMGREVTVTSEEIRALPEVLHSSRSGRVSSSESGYIEGSLEIAVIYHDPLPVLPEPPPQMSTDSIR
ncbi:VMAP-C domain-containing protein [Nocardiopsis lucentensis]|uniref:VMAP-C domain-containing protein n=1 Tax=Nocardiopsis lucentensis TaxID=53441 RepID=UPI0003462EF3|nr:hypothetical protein [Nocardiopsis lucentensis]